MRFLRQIFESFRFSWQALRSNLLRTTLSLLGVTVGIFAIIAVFTLVDSLERNIKDSLSFIGDKVVYVQKWPWIFGGEFQWWKYFQRPVPTYSEYRFLSDRLESAEAIVAMDFKGRVTIKHDNNSMASLIQGTTLDYNKISEVPIEQGRYFTQQEIDVARNVAIIGADVAENLFPGQDPVGKTFKLSGHNFTVIGVQRKKGESILNVGGNPDIKCLIPYGAFAKMFHSVQPDIDIAIKGYDTDEGLVELESEIRGLLRTRRGLRPLQEDNFAINRPEAAAQAISGIFSVLTIAGWIIGGFSILIGGFGIANIMFVSVKERTNIIGIQKSLGAKNYFILCQFLFEAVLLSLVGGIAGIFLVYLLSFMDLGSLDLQLTPGNITLGLAVSSVIGILSGIIPAFSAARMDPVIAIRAK
ncbi:MULTISPECIES: ABC transporter permease [unclassified Spirosoma]|uniref:ABC transporter permease n=1 Tax=unclassified Spirosoma TaxID=2621999 RepID=UPI000960CD19|nr:MULTISPECIES: ABC transporter permease [unclassified Spirosoma]MBN8822391.1 ABC transporter permease [Spirosoma sp.]OJW73743.1 MAG: ABC transporter [Spirosoma sp. 48-14]